MSASTGTKKTVDMSVRVGGRVVTPFLGIVDASDPTALEKSFDESLQTYIAQNVPLESTEGIQRRERALNRMGTLVREWIRSVCTRRGLPQDVIDNAGGQLFTSGSYRLGVHEPGADIDTILVAPNMCTRQDFFGAVLEEREDGTIIRDPESLAERIRAHPDVTNFVPVEGAAVPLLTFDWEGVNIDLLFARLPSASVPASLDIDNDKVLDGVDSATEKSLNGPRVTNLIAALVGGTPERYQTFLTVVRCVRKWAKARGIYSNKMGYWGGVNINIGVALTVQLYPTSCPASLLRRFFMLFSTWRFPTPVLLTKQHDAGLGLPVWTYNLATSRNQVFPMITPAYPAMNSTLSMSNQTRQIVMEEFLRGRGIVQRLWNGHQKHPSKELDWSELFEPSDFFINYPNYLSVCIVAPSQEDIQTWSGFVESRLRKLVSDTLAKSLPIKKIQLWPKKFQACVADRAALLTLAQRKNSITYFIGFQVEMLRMRGNALEVERLLNTFRDIELARFTPLVPGMDVLVKPFKCKELPKMCFEGTYVGGKEEAMKKRRAIRDADPRRQEKKRRQRLQQLKEKMAEMQKKREQAAAAADESQVDDDGDKKRKRDDADDDDKAVDVDLEGESKLLKTEDENAKVKEEVDEEADILEDVLDAIELDTGAKTREEAEADRQKLLAGEMLVEGDVQSDDEDEAGYTGEGARQMILPSKKKAEPTNMRSLPLPKEDAELLRRIGAPVVSDEDTKIVGGGGGENDLPPGRRRQGQEIKPLVSAKIKFRTKFDIVELDASGRIVDKGDDDFMPSKKWIGRKGGMEFKLGARGLGYYRTGKEVVVPSNTAY